MELRAEVGLRAIRATGRRFIIDVCNDPRAGELFKRVEAKVDAGNFDFTEEEGEFALASIEALEAIDPTPVDELLRRAGSLKDASHAAGKTGATKTCTEWQAGSEPKVTG